MNEAQIPIGDAGEHLYFAYGSNMSPRRARARIGSHLLDNPDEPLGVATMPDRVLRFHKLLDEGSGAADLVERDPCSVLPAVHGVVWRVTSRGLRRLDMYEGVAWGHYRRVRERLAMLTGEIVEAWVYLAEPQWVLRGLRPSRHYLRYLLDGACQFLPGEYSAWLASHRCVEDCA